MYPNVLLFSYCALTQLVLGDSRGVPASDDVTDRWRMPSALIDVAISTMRTSCVVPQAPFDHSKVMFKVANPFCNRLDAVTPSLASQQYKLLPEPGGDMPAGADRVGWFNEDARPTCVGVIPNWIEWVYRPVVNLPASSLVAFTLGNFPIHHVGWTLPISLATGRATTVRLPGGTRRRVRRRVRPVSWEIFS